METSGRKLYHYQQEKAAAVEQIGASVERNPFPITCFGAEHMFRSMKRDVNDLEEMLVAWRGVPSPSPRPSARLSATAARLSTMALPIRELSDTDVALSTA